MKSTPPSPLRLPPELASCEDLTERVRSAGPAAGGPSPFDGEPAFEAVFAGLARARRRPDFLHAGHGLRAVAADDWEAMTGDHTPPAVFSHATGRGRL